MTRLVLLAAALSVAALLGCTGTCGQLDDAFHGCGQSFDVTQCDKAIDSCTSDDVKTLENVADCLSNEAVCKDGKTVDSGKAFTCQVSILSVSKACGEAF